MTPRKTRVLLVGESSWLPTGYGTMASELLYRLNMSGQFDLCELGSAGAPGDPRARNRPWPFVYAVPENEIERQLFEANPFGAHGGWRFEETCLAFKPDIVWAFRDPWVDAFLAGSPFRPFYHLSLMPTVDSENQHPDWMDVIRNADSVFAYTEFSQEVLNREGGGLVKTCGTASPGVDHAVFKNLGPAAKEALKAGAGLPTDAVVVGMVGRNQPRKLFPDLIQTFGEILREGPELVRRTAYLYLHTGHPDLGCWDIPGLIANAGIGHRTLVTYSCISCGAAFSSVYRDSVTVCKECGVYGARLPSPDHSPPREVLACIYNLMDVYVQLATNEGFGVPLIEAASCELPVMATDYSATSDIVRKLSGTPIPIHRFYIEPNSGRKLALPDNRLLGRLLVEALSKPASIRMGEGRRAREGVLRHYTWEKSAETWGNHFLKVQLKDERQTWASPSRQFNPPTILPDNLSSDEFVRWCMRYLAGRPDLVGGFSAARMARDLAWAGPSGRDTVTKTCAALAADLNHWEGRRCA